MMRSGESLSRVIWWVLLAALLTGHLVFAWQSLTVFRFWEDEAYNLSVPLNLVRGLGYTSDGTLSGWVLERSVLTPFDVRISTGPTVLLPAAAVLEVATWFGADLTGQTAVILARIVPLAYWFALLIGLWRLAARISGRWGSLLAVALPLGFTAAASESPLQGPADLLGEVPTAAFLVWALLALRRRPWLAGLLFGLAIQTKYIALLAAPALVVAALVLAGQPWRSWFGVLWRPIVWALVPTLLVEIVALATLGPHGYGIRIVYTGGFLVGGGQQPTGTTIPEKLHTLASAWFLPPVIVGIVAVLAIAAIVTAALIVRAHPDRWPARGLAGPRELTAMLAAASIGTLAYVGWWAQAEHTPLWVRHPAPGLLAFLPLLAAFLVLAIQVLVMRPASAPAAAALEGTTHARPRALLTAVAGAALVSLAAGSASQQIVRAVEPRAETLADQSRIADDLESALAALPAGASRWVAADPWGPAVSIGVMMGRHTGLESADAMAGEPRISGPGTECADPAAEAGPYALCLP